MNPATMTVLICHLGGLGSTQQAQPVIDDFLQHLKASGGWTKTELRGSYHTSAWECAEMAKKQKPAIVVVDVATFLSQRRAWRLSPVAQMGKTGSRLFVLANRAKYPTLKKLKGATLVTALSVDPKLLYSIVLKRKVAPGFFKVSAVRRPLKALRAVSRGKAAAALVDQAAYDYMRSMKRSPSVEALHISEPLPRLTVAITRHGSKHKNLRQRIEKALPHLCKDAGQKLCANVGVQTFTPADKRAYAKLAKRYR